MFRRIKQNTPQIDNAIAKAANFEIQIMDMTRRNEKRSWFVAYASVLMCAIMAISYVFILPLNKIEHYMVIANPYTNLSRVARLDDDKAFVDIVSSEPILKRVVSDYIRARESFDFPSTGYRDFYLVQYMSTSKVFGSYLDIHKSTNPDEPFKEFGREKALRVNFVDIDLRSIDDKEDMQNEAVVRFQRIVYEKNGGKAKLHDSKIATLEFTFDRSLLSDPNQRANNPLGFLVTAYRMDNDSSAPPPPPDDAAPVGQQNPQTAASAVQAVFAPQQSSAGQNPQGQQVPSFGAPATGPASNAQPQVQYPAQPAAQPQPTAPAGQAPNQVNGVRN
jgi:type IV secretion system protein VirB8